MADSTRARIAGSLRQDEPRGESSPRRSDFCSLFVLNLRREIGAAESRNFRIRRPVSRVLSAPPAGPRDDHSSGTPVARRLARPTRTTGPETGLPRAEAAGPSSLLGLAPGGVCRAAAVAGDAVRSYRTLSPSPAGRAVKDRGPGGQTALCGTFPRVAPAGRYPAPCFRGARTFLPRGTSGAAIRPPDPPDVGLAGALELVDRLTAAGHAVVRLVRRRAQSTDEASWSPAAGIIDFTVMDRVDAVVNLAGASLARIPWTKNVRGEILDSRVTATCTLAMRCARPWRPPPTFISASAVGYYGDRPGELLTEYSSAGTGFLARGDPPGASGQVGP